MTYQTHYATFRSVLSCNFKLTYRCKNINHNNNNNINNNANTKTTTHIGRRHLVDQLKEKKRQVLFISWFQSYEKYKSDKNIKYEWAWIVMNNQIFGIIIITKCVSFSFQGLDVLSPWWKILVYYRVNERRWSILFVLLRRKNTVEKR